MLPDRPALFDEGVGVTRDGSKKRHTDSEQMLPGRSRANFTRPVISRILSALSHDRWIYEQNPALPFAQLVKIEI
jgi:hypothetical protein